MKDGLGNLMRQAQQMQANMQKAQEQLAELEVQGQSGGGMVRITMSCRYEVRKVEIDDKMIGDDREMLEDLIAAATNDALRKVEQTTQEKFSGMTAGMNLPAGMKLPF
jgi:hypothetical protein